LGRIRRKWHPQYFDHVVVRGNNRQILFHEAADFQQFLRILHYIHDKYSYTLLAYCLMNNHFHLLIRSDVPLSKVMMLINRRYSDYYKKKYRYTGHLYEHRYFSDMILTSDGVLEVSRYIHQNPIRTKTPLVTKLEHYPYSSYQYFKKQNAVPSFLQPELLLSFFRLESQRTYNYYCEYCEQKNSQA